MENEVRGSLIDHVRHDEIITPEARDALMEVVEAARGVIQKTEDEDGLEWVSLVPAGQQRLWKALVALGFDV